MELLTLEALAFTSTADSVIAQLEPIAGDDTNSSALRLHAAFLGASAADNLHDAHALSRFRSIGDSVAASSPDALAQLRLALVAECAIGDLTRAVETAQAYLKLARAQMNAASLATALRHSSYAFRRAGDRERAHALLLESGHLSAQLHLVYSQFRAADVRAGLELDYERLDCAEAALRDADKLFAPALGEFFRESLAISWAFWAIETEDWGTARRTLDGLRPLDYESRSRHVILSAAARMRTAMQEGNDDGALSLLQYILKHTETLFEHSSVDQVACAVFVALAHFKGAREAHQFAQKFTRNQRRDRSPVPRLLAAALR
jgi:hypothetical protein